VLGAKWNEFDLENALWTVPAARMKAHRDHRVPLPQQCLKMLTLAKESAGSSVYVFPCRNSSRPLSNMALLMLMRRMEETVTVHGFRSAFRDWAAERTHFSREVCELALAHTIKNKAEAAYRRGDLLEKRRALMDAWAELVTGSDSAVLKVA
jgi:integrase